MKGIFFHHVSELCHKFILFVHVNHIFWGYYLFRKQYFTFSGVIQDFFATVVGPNFIFFYRIYLL
jgi:hypothetical protein